MALVKYLKFIFTRTFFLYLACFFLIWQILDYPKLYRNVVTQTMSRLTPPIDYFTEFVDRGDNYDRFKLMNCIYYHKAVVHYFDFQKAEGYGMLGFCYERLGQLPEAMASYTKAIASNPDYFWPYYDLGVIFYRQARYSQAEDYFQQAIAQAPIKTVVLLSQSKVYNDVRLSKTVGSYDFLEGLKQGRTSVYILLMDSLNKTGSYEELWKTALDGFKEGLDTHGIFYYYAGVAAFNLKAYQKSMNFLQMALQIDPRNADALLYMGMCLKMEDKADMARLFINKAAQLHQQGGLIIEKYLKPQVRFF